MNSNFNLIDAVCMSLVVLICFRGVSSFPSGEVSNIAGGEYAQSGEFPYQVSIKSRYYTTRKYNSPEWSTIQSDEHFCGGAIIGQDIVLSAAHCFDNADQPAFGCPNREHIIQRLMLQNEGVFQYHGRYVRAGVTNNINDNEPYLQMRDVQFISFHPLYEEGFRFCHLHAKTDLALVFLAAPFYYNQFVQPIPLARYVPQTKITECIFSGWGHHRDQIDTTAHLLKKLIEIVHTDAISDTIKVDHSSVMINNTLCKGDSGGPLVCNGQLMGIAWRIGTYEGFGCPAQDETYSSVPFHLHWLEQTIINSGRRIFLK